MRFGFNFFDAPHLIAVHNQVSQFVRSVEPRARSIVLVATEHDYRMIRKR
jgi:hypothetical protein